MFINPTIMNMEEKFYLKDEGTKLMHEGKYEDAIKSFTAAIGEIEADSDDEALFKSVCLLNRSNCRILMNNLGDAFEDASLVVYLFKIRQPKFSILNPENSPKNLLSIYALAEQRKAEIYESINDLHNAIQAYSLYAKLSNINIKDCLHGIYSKLGFPNIESSDDELSPYMKFYDAITSEGKVLEALGNIISLFQDNSQIFTDDYLNKFIENGCFMFFFGILYLFIDHNVVVQAVLFILKSFAELGIQEIYDGLPVIRSIIDHYATNKDIIGQLFIYLKYAPDSAIDKLEINDFLVPLMKLIKLDLSPEESDAGFWILFRAIKSKDNYAEARKNGVIDSIFVKATKSSVLLLSKLCQNDECCAEAHAKGAIQFCIAVLNKVTDQMIIVSALIVVARILLTNLPDTEQYSQALIQTIVPIIIKHSKNEEIISNGFAILTICTTRIPPDLIREVKIIKVSGLLLIIHHENPSVLKNVISFLYVCSLSSLSKEISEDLSLLNNLLQIVTKNISNEDIATKGIAIAINCNHPVKMKLADIGIRTYPNSHAILSAVQSLNYPQNSKETK